MAIRSTSAASAPEHNPTTSGLSTETMPLSTDHRRQRRTRLKLRRLLRSLVLTGTAAMVLVGSTGCSMFSNVAKQVRKAECLNDFMIDHRNKVFAARAWYRTAGHHANCRYPAEYKAGFMQGYQDVANGSNGCLPCVAPSQYWGWKYQSPGGQAAIDEWFAGYPLGVKAAEQDGVGYWSQMRTMARYPASAKPETAEPVPAPAPVPMNSEVILGPDGQPITAEGEMIVPGSEQIIDTKTTPLELEPATELPGPPMPVLPEPGSDGILNVPGFGDETSLESSSEDLVYRPGPDTNEWASENVGEGNYPEEPALVPRQSGPTYSLNDLGDDAIEGIFGSIDFPNNSDTLTPAANISQSQSESSMDDGSVIETANASDDDIPFKFE